MLLTVGIRVTSSLCILERPFSLGCLNTAGRICLHVSSVTMHILNTSVIFPSVESVCSLALSLRVLLNVSLCAVAAGNVSGCCCCFCCSELLRRICMFLSLDDEVRVMLLLQKLVRSVVAHCFEAVNCHNSLHFFPGFWHTKTFRFSSFAVGHFFILLVSSTYVLCVRLSGCNS